MSMFDYFRDHDELNKKPNLPVNRPSLVAELARRALLAKNTGQTPDFFAPADDTANTPTTRPRLVAPPLPSVGDAQENVNSGFSLQIPDRRAAGNDTAPLPPIAADRIDLSKLAAAVNVKLPEVGGDQTATRPRIALPEIPVNSNPIVDGSTTSLPEVGMTSNASRPRVVPYQTLSQDEQLNQDIRRKNELLINGAPKEGIWRRLLNGAVEGLSHNDGQGGWGGLLGSAIGGAAVDAASPKIEARQRANREIGQIDQRIGSNLALKDKQLDQQMKQAQVDYATKRPDIEQQKIDQKGKDLDERTKANTMRVVASVYNRLPSFNSKDPNNADIVAQMQSLGIPVIDKTPNRDVRYVQDEDSGEMFIVSTDKQTGQTSAEQVMQNGQPLKVTTKSQIGMRIKDLDRQSQQKIAEARNSTLLKVAGMNNDSRERVANINQQGASDRVQSQIKAADERQKTQLLNNSLSKWQQQFQKANFRAPTQAEIEQAKQSIQNTIYGQQ